MDMTIVMRNREWQLLVDVSDGASCPEVITRTWTYTDACGNIATVSQLITVDDTQVPVMVATTTY